MSAAKRLTQSIWPVIGLAAALRFVGLGRLSLWYDEAFTAWLARLPFPQMLAATAGDVHPPTWYVIEGVFVQVLGGSEWALRLPSAILGVVNVWLTWRVAQDWGLGRRVAWLAALLLAVSPAAVWYSQEARTYQLLSLGVLLMALAVARWRWPLFVAGGIVTVWSHNLGAFFVLALAGAALARERRNWFFILEAGVAILLAWLPWLVVLARQAAHVAAGFWVPPVTVGTWLHAWVFLLMGPSGLAGVSLAGSLAALGLAALAAAVGIRERRWALLAWLLGPGLLLVGVSLAWRPVFMYRWLLPVVPALAILLALAVDRSRTARWIALPAVVVVVVCLAAIHVADDAKPTIREHAAMIRDGWQGGDLVFHGNLASYILFDYYLPDLENAVWRQANDLSQSLTGETKEAMGMNQLTVNDLADYRRLWVVWTENPMMSGAESAVIGGMLKAWPSEVVATIEDNPAMTSRIYLVSLEQDETGFQRRPPLKTGFAR